MFSESAGLLWVIAVSYSERVSLEEANAVLSSACLGLEAGDVVLFSESVGLLSVIAASRPG